MSALWNYLNSPQLVCQFQRLFGVEATKKEDDDVRGYRVRNKFFYYLFLIGTELGDELFYGIFIPFCFFNLDAYIARRFVFNWCINMYIGQALKELFLETRPKHPAIQMQKKWSNEYSLPSTHAMSAPSIAITIIYFALDRYEVNFIVASMFAVIWISIVSWSRVYLGMHSVLDLLMGFMLSAVILGVCLPCTEALELFLAKNFLSPFILIPNVIFLIKYFPIPSTKIWTPTRGDTTSIIGVFTGVELGNWLNYQCGYLQENDLTYPLSLEINDYFSFTFRSVSGLALIAATEFIGKEFIYSILCKAFNEDKEMLKKSPDSIENEKKNFIDLTTKFITYSILGFNTLFTAPIMFKYFHIQRDAFYNEI